VQTGVLNSCYRAEMQALFRNDPFQGNAGNLNERGALGRCDEEL